MQTPLCASLGPFAAKIDQETHKLVNPQSLWKSWYGMVPYRDAA